MESGVKKRMRGFLTIVFLLFAVAAHAKSASEIYDAVSSSIVVIRTYDANGKNLRLGSGVALASDLIATNCHVIEHAAKTQVVHRGKEYSATLRHSDWDRDICTLTVSGINAPAVVTGSTNRLKVGARVYAIGAPHGLELTLSEGIISSLRPVEGGRYLQISAPISSGSSGGGLFDENGQLIGLTTFYLAEGQQLNFAVPVEWISELAKRHKKTVKGAATSTIDWLEKALALEEKEDWARLLTHSLRWTNAQPNQAVAWFSLGVAYTESGHYSKAIDAYEQALRIDPEDARAWMNLGVAYRKSGQYAKAIEAHQKSLRLDPEDARAWNNLAVAYERSLQKSKAIEAYQQALRIEPEYANVWNNLGMTYGESGQAAKSIEAFQQAVRINPEYAEAWYNLGVEYKKSGQTNQVREVHNLLKTLDMKIADQFFKKVVKP
jgi:tetratricopeptide (TPR) repeat protein